MKIQKPQKLENLEEKELNHILEMEEIKYAYFQNQECDEISLWDFQFECCKWNRVSMQKAKMEKVTFRDILFENCNFSNTDFVECSFIRCEFRNCKISGCNFAENGLYHISFVETNANYSNLSMASIENVLWKESQMRNSYFQETKIRNIGFEQVDLTQAQFFKTSLKGIDVSTCKIEGIAISLEDIKGAIVDGLQAMDLLYLLGVKVKKE